MSFEKFYSIAAISAFTLLGIMTYAHAGNEVLVIPYNANGHVNEKIKVMATYKFNLKNEETTLQNYLVIEKLIINNREYKIGWGFSLAPNQVKRFEKLEAVEYIADSTGRFTIKGALSIAGKPSLTHESHATLEVN